LKDQEQSSPVAIKAIISRKRNEPVHRSLFRVGQIWSSAAEQKKILLTAETDYQKICCFVFFNAEISTVTIYQKQHSVHFGVKSESSFTNIPDLIKTTCKLRETPVDGNVSNFASEMLHRMTMVTFNLSQ